MTAENAIIWITAEGFNQWRLENSKGDKVSDFIEEESFSDALERMKTIFPLLQPGKYVLKGWKGKNKQAAQSLFEFEVKAHSVSHHASNSGQGASASQLFDEAKRAAYMEFQADAWKKDIENRVVALEKMAEQFEELKRSVRELHDDDEENDESALSRITNMAETAPKIMNAFEGMRGLLTRKM